MQDSFYEQFVGAHESTSYKVVKIIMRVSIVFAILYLFSGVILGVMGLILSVLCAIIYFFYDYAKRKNNI
ncbi:hypothetical protein AGR56_10015 [Clostridium sp. DMHC 10]|uniref:hypothetical protein n=1 Tax=Clostridium sp. DMHC 10 TaxID=747377 RepID=UPI00069F4CB0|nr:hypothetical protein [Clostridium sp. DMHC 10]KOF56932.1 hypothetical protein AGR56_10015 [Clostridium sp. DMHC 10]